MQSGRKAVETVKESAANTEASAKAGMEKAQASAEEKAVRITTSDPLEKEATSMKKEERQAIGELNKEEARAYNEAARRAAETGGPHPGYKTWGSTEDTTIVPPTADAPYTETEDYPTTGTWPTAGTATGDPLHPRGTAGTGRRFP